MERAPLMENQLLKTVGNRLPKCQGGAAELSTMVLGDGDEFVNCHTQPTCFAHFDLCICQLCFTINAKVTNRKNTAGQLATF